MSRPAAGLFVIAIATLGCQTLYEELPAEPSELAQQQPRAEPTPTPTLITLPVQVVPAPTPTPTSPGSPAPEPTPEPNPQPTPTPAPQPTPTPSQSCGNIQITIDASCPGAFPDCGIDGSSKQPVLEAANPSSVVLDASYYIKQPRNKVHSYDPCYPGPIERWSQVAGGSVECSAPFSNGHVTKCGPFSRPGSYGFEACGQGICGWITVTVR